MTYFFMPKSMHVIAYEQKSINLLLINECCDLKKLLELYTCLYVVN